MFSVTRKPEEIFCLPTMLFEVLEKHRRFIYCCVPGDRCVGRSTFRGDSVSAGGRLPAGGDGVLTWHRCVER